MTPELVNQFKEQGFCLVKNGLPADLLAQWRKVADDAKAQGLAAHNNDEYLPGTSINEEDGRPLVILYNNIAAIEQTLLLTTLASPALLNIARHIVGRGCVPVNVDIQYKYNHPYNWHQDGSVSRKHPYITVGLYLDDADEDDGCVQYLPGSQHTVLDVQKFEQDYGWEIPGQVMQPAKAGDILAHDSMVLHGSKPKRHGEVRRNLYIEFWTLEALAETGKFSQRWLDMRQQWMSLILQWDRQHIWPDKWRNDYSVGPDATTLLKDIFENPEVGMKPNWGTFPVDRDDYPIPTDMRNN